MTQWNRNTVPKCDVGKYSDEVLVTVEHIGCDCKIYRRGLMNIKNKRYS